MIAAASRTEPPRAPIKHQPVKVAEVQAAITVIGRNSVCRSIQTTHIDYHESVAGYFRQVGEVFCRMADNGDFTHEGMVRAVNGIPSPLLTDTYALDVKIALMALYKVTYGDRLRAEIPPDRWLAETSKVFCESISEGLKDAGKTGITN